MSGAPRPIVRRSVAALLALATLAVYASVFGAEFISLDDPEYVVNNEHVASGLSLSGLRWAFSTGHAGNWHPLTWISHMLDVQLFGLRAGMHHATSLLLHVANAWLLLVVLARMTRAFWPSAFVAALFALHPLHVESVAWVAERKDVLSTLLLLLTLLAWTRHLERPGPARYALALVLYALGLMAKPMLVTLPCLLLLLDVWPLRRWSRGTVTRLVAEKLPFLLLAAASSVITFLVQDQAGAVATVELLTPVSRAGNALASYLLYLRDTAWPAQLAVYYPMPRGEQGALAGTALLVLLLVSVLAWRERARRPWMLVGWLWYLGMLVPVIGIVQVGAQARADRYTYVPLIGVFIVVAWGGAEVLRHRPRFAATLAVGVLLALSAVTVRVAGCWRDSLSLFTRALERTQDNLLAHQVVSASLSKRGDREGAIHHLHEALRISPADYDANYALGSLLGPMGQAAEAEARFRQALLAKPSSADALFNLGTALLDQGRVEEAHEAWNRARKHDPGHFETNRQLGILLAQDRKLDEALIHLRRALEERPTDFQTNSRIGKVLGSKGRFEEALVHLRRALAAEPGDVETRRGSAVTLILLGRPAEGIAEYAALLERAPGDIDALNNVAWIRATHVDPAQRNGAEAVRLAERARGLSREEHPLLLDTLAAAYAEAGRFTEAVESCRRALVLAEAGSDAAEAARIRAHLELFESGQPLRIR